MLIIEPKTVIIFGARCLFFLNTSLSVRPQIHTKHPHSNIVVQIIAMFDLDINDIENRNMINTLTTNTMDM